MLSDYYPWIKAFHIIFVLFWMSGLFYLPRLFAYHSKEESGTEQWDTFCVMERRLSFIIMTPSMVVAWVLGLFLFSGGGVDVFAWWIWGKLVLVAAMTWYHAILLRWRSEFAEGSTPHGPAFFRAVNEVPPLLAVGVVILVVVRPF
ncbi:MAG: CopD family protein [Hyphomicrobiales bacterium]|nr:CopD family protein [Hyphomicrobiales bacterium]